MIDFETFLIDGVAEIDILIKARTSDVLLHAHDLNITKATVRRQTQQLELQSSKICPFIALLLLLVFSCLKYLFLIIYLFVGMYVVVFFLFRNNFVCEC
jgi:lysylphosphatidylglycerol synthetase-like protein (DUF2156 family)